MYQLRPSAWILPLVIFGYPILALLTAKYLADADSGIQSIVLRTGIALLGIWTALAGGRDASATSRRYYYIVLAFWLFYVSRIWYDGVYRELPLPFTAAEYFGYMLIFSVAPALGAMRGMTEVDLRVALRLFGAAAAAFVILLLLRAGELTRISFLLERNRMGSNALNPIAIGQASASAVLYAVFMVTRRWTAKGRLERPTAVDRALLWICMLGGVSGLILSASRGPLMALIVAALMMLWPLVSLRTLGGIFAGSLASIVTFVVAARFVGDELSFSILTRFSAAMTDPYGDASSAARLDVAVGALTQFMEHPVFGSSLVERASNFYPHNVILEAFMSTGLVGGLMLTYLCLVTLRLAWGLCSQENGWPLIGALSVQAVVGSLFSGALYGNSAMWYLMLLVLSTAVAVELRPGAVFERQQYP